MSSKRIYSIYRIVNSINDKSYIGWTSRNPETRFKEHLNIKTNMVISFAVRKHGRDKFHLEIIYQTLDCDHSREMEGFFISQYNSLTESEGGWGYNVDIGSKGHKRSRATIEKHRSKIKGRSQSEEHKEKRRLSITGEKNGMHGRTGDTHPRFNVEHTDDTKMKISDTQKLRISNQKANGTYKKSKNNAEGIEKMKKTKLLQAETGESLRYKNIVIQDSSGNIINLPINYPEYFRSIRLNNFMSKSIKNPGVVIKGFILISYELND